MTASEPDQAHKEKVQATADGERLVAHSTFTEGDRDLRAVADRGEVIRREAFDETGFVAAPNTGDYHAARRAAKQAAGILPTADGEEIGDDPSKIMVEPMGNVNDAARQGAARARKADGQERRQAPQGRRAQPTTTTTTNQVRPNVEGGSAPASSAATEPAAPTASPAKTTQGSAAKSSGSK